MEIKNVLKKENIFLGEKYTKKNEVFTHIASHLVKQGLANDDKEVVDALNERERISPTGFENGIAIPHAQTTSVKETTIVSIRVDEHIQDWESIDPNNQVKLIFAILVPKDASNEHIKLLSSLATKLMDLELVGNLKTCSSKDEFINLLCKEKEEEESTITKDKYILAITACATGIAHTYMAAEAIEKEAKKQGYRVKVEKQGAAGIEDEIKMEDVKQASGVIFAHDVALKNLGRFDGLQYIDVKVAKPMHDPEGCIKEVVNSTKIYRSEEVYTEETSKSRKDEIMEAIMTGISYMLPVIIAGGLLMGIAKLSALIIGGDDLVNNLGNAITVTEEGTVQYGPTIHVLLAYLDKFGWLLMQFMYPLFAAYVAYSLADRNALLPGFLGGIFAQGLHTKILALPESPAGIMQPFIGSATVPAVPSGFIGALILGLVSGYFVRLISKVKFNKNLSAMRTMLFIPGLSVLFIVFLNMFIVEPVFGSFNLWLQQVISENSQSSYIYATIVAAATAFDLGGPINKAAGTVAMGLAADNVLPLTARTLAIVIPPLGLGLATVLDKFIVGKHVFSEEERVLGKSSLLLGFLAISEGAIPFMLKNPMIVVPINIIGAIIGALVGVSLGAVQWLPLPAIWGWPLVDNIPAYLIGMTTGALFIAIANILVRNNIAKKETKKGE